jgi:DNA transformation protein and related proteins
MSRDDLVELCRDLLAPAGAVRVRRMFGGHGFYVDELFVAILASGQLYLKTDETTRERFAEAGCAPFVYSASGRTVSLNYWTVPAEAMESPALMQPWLRLALQAALSARSQPAKTPPAARRRTGTSSRR